MDFDWVIKAGWLAGVLVNEWLVSELVSEGVSMEASKWVWVSEQMSDWGSDYINL